MHVITVKQARDELEQALEDVCWDREPIVIVRKRGGPVVLIPLNDYEGLQETIYLLGSDANAKRLRKSVAQLRSATPSTADFKSIGEGQQSSRRDYLQRQS
jgi:antitoxin YefM